MPAMGMHCLALSHGSGVGLVPTSVIIRIEVIAFSMLTPLIEGPRCIKTEMNWHVLRKIDFLVTL